MRRAALVAAGLWALSAGAAGQQMTPLEKSGFDHFYNLEYDAALADFTAAARQQPQRASLANHIAETLIYKEMLRIGALESQLYGHGDPFLEEKLLPPDPRAAAAVTAAIERATALGQGEVAAGSGDAHAHYDLGATWALRGTWDFAVRKSYLAALGDAKKARAEAERAVALEPGFVDPQLILGVHNYIAGSLPFTAKIFSLALGYSGDKAKGRAQIENVREHGENARTDATVMLVILDRRDGYNREAAPLLAELVGAFPRNVLYAVELAECLEAAGEHDAARAQYQAIVAAAARRAPGFEQAPLDKVWYDQGNIERIYSRWPQAEADYLKAEQAPQAQPRYQQAAALAAGEMEDKMGHHEAAVAQYRRCVEIDATTPAGRAARGHLGG